MINKIILILIGFTLFSCSTGKNVVNKTDTKENLTPTIKYYNKKLNSRKYGLS